MQVVRSGVALKIALLNERARENMHVSDRCWPDMFYKQLHSTPVLSSFVMLVILATACAPHSPYESVRGNMTGGKGPLAPPSPPARLKVVVGYQVRAGFSRGVKGRVGGVCRRS